MRIYLCEACRLGDHSACEGSHPAPPGVFGGSRCSCNCNNKSVPVQLISNLRVTHTFATLEVTERTFNEIKKKLEAAGYQHTFLDDGNTIDMHGIGLVPEEKKTKKKSK